MWPHVVKPALKLSLRPDCKMDMPNCPFITESTIPVPVIRHFPEIYYQQTQHNDVLKIMLHHRSILFICCIKKEMNLFHPAWLNFQIPPPTSSTLSSYLFHYHNR
ncbi:hypothetical protein Tsp_03421 [Trichinella spiralis]|uniref:hypothetical protein n=1 Tax=Trichinella spiralis TaxID=6334 RepID=UPI0001EFCDC7|nr:hypothetical protein Tsp_03421 [Trichinella spiralis]